MQCLQPRNEHTENIIFGTANIPNIIKYPTKIRMDGFTFIKTIRAQDAYKDIPIIVLSTEGQEKDIQTGMGDGSVILILDPHEIYIMATSKAPSIGAGGEQGKQPVSVRM